MARILSMNTHKVESASRPVRMKMNLGEDVFSVQMDRRKLEDGHPKHIPADHNKLMKWPKYKIRIAGKETEEEFDYYGPLGQVAANKMLMYSSLSDIASEALHGGLTEEDFDSVAGPALLPEVKDKYYVHCKEVRKKILNVITEENIETLYTKASVLDPLLLLPTLPFS